MSVSIAGGFTAPSGQQFSPDDLSLLLKLERNGTISWSDREIMFNAGFKSHVYFRGRNDLSHNLSLLEQVAAIMWNKLAVLPRTHGAQWCLIGIPTAGTQLAQAISHISRDPTRAHGTLANFSTMRSVLKNHGKDHMWVGEPRLHEFSYVTVENIVSTAKAMLENFAKLRQDGYPTREMHHLVFADWGLGGVEALRDADHLYVHVCFKMQDIMAAYVHLGHWPEERYQEMTRRIVRWNVEHG